MSFRVGEEVWLHPDKGEPALRHRCRITNVATYPGAVVLYDTDYTWMAEGRDEPSLAVGMSAHWLAPLSAIDRLGDVAVTTPVPVPPNPKFKPRDYVAGTDGVPAFVVSSRWNRDAQTWTYHLMFDDNRREDALEGALGRTTV